MNLTRRGFFGVAGAVLAAGLLPLRLIAKRNAKRITADTRAPDTLVWQGTYSDDWNDARNWKPQRKLLRLRPCL